MKIHPLLEIRTYFLDRYNISDPDYKLIETVIIESRPHKAGPQWKFSGAFYFSVVVVALIGITRRLYHKLSTHFLIDPDLLQTRIWAFDASDYKRESVLHRLRHDRDPTRHFHVSEYW